ncbi:Fe(3+)-hydroxamate ABC transporter permease FhuB [Ancylobacter defluvii]|uniref:Fe3+-hydroxamate ABC transporter permease FhuB n=1 Tax=Ancylobacter defluvii TaxID=1282440 RepID=A0A9W6NBL1_9HYPH|nr:Fe(3+)-hydroxamate ABC transporter permease FhuB [Ancylobacter defluvii]MBS7589103.1 Fe(3+)-hydroxamate ABC transporter permease FhuB [Ancylobacter defluvii]GLK84715.1 Fe3+-hydroxamate ABC transporter permease FhuB [Ancylobacter defluvii]
MAELAAQRLPAGGVARCLRRFGPAGLVILLGLLAIGATIGNLAARLPAALWWGAFLAPDALSPAQMLVAYSFAPRLAVSLLAGAALGLAGALLQQVLRNPIASPTTLGIEAGANLALAAGLVWAPGLIGFGREWVALGGGVLALAMVLLLSRRSGFSPLVVILAGMVTSLTCAALAASITLFNSHYLAGLFLWGAGSLSQQDWSEPAFLAPRLAAFGLAAALLVRPLALLGLDDASARSLGLSLVAARFGALLVAVALTACVVAAVGCIGFIGLAAPALARISGARRAGAQLLVSALLGAVLLWATDQGVQLAAGAYGEMLPTGAVTALLGAPLLLWLVPRLRLPPHALAGLPTGAGSGGVRPARVLALVAGLLVLAILVSVSLGPGLDGWSLAWPGDPASLWSLRLPRALAALAGGMLLAVAGCLLQRMTGNPMASPEVMGVSAGAACGLTVALFLLADFGPVEQTAAASLGALLALLALLALGRTARGAPERVILVGIAVGALLDALVSVLMASGDPRAVLLFNWMAGSTYGMGAATAAASLAAAALVLALLPLLARWLDMLPLGAAATRALGVPPALSRLLLLVLAAVATAMATLLVGPLSFVGLMAPHLARLIGLRRPLPELYGAALLGGLIMVLADFAGRVVAFPWQMPAGLVASMIGAPAFLWLLSRKQNAS